MAEIIYDLAVIGSGPGGYMAALKAADLGLKVVCVEKDPTLGGTCLNVGCIPSKALLQSSEDYEFMEHDAKNHGINFSNLSCDFSKMQERKAGIVAGLVGGIATLFQLKGVVSSRGTATFVSPEFIEVSSSNGTERIQAKNYLLATGSEPIPLPFLPFDEKRILSSTGALALPAPPKKLLMIGAGVIGVELASVYRRLGTEVHIIEMLEVICPTMDRAISKSLLQILKKQGMQFYLGAKVASGGIEGNEVKLSVELQGKTQEFTGDAVLVAVGRRPYSRGLGLDKIGIQTTKQGFVPVDGNFRTSIPHIYAIGDLIEGPMLAHKATEEGVAAVEIIAGGTPHINYISIPSIIYTHPEVAAIGFTEEEARNQGLELKIGTAYFKANGRARCIGFTDGWVKVIAEKNSERLLGMHIIGPMASEMTGEAVMALNKGATLSDIVYASHPHPTLTETILEAAQKSQIRKVRAPRGNYKICKIASGKISKLA
jgi:dihydrolipoamide dehydrogenase